MSKADETSALRSMGRVAEGRVRGWRTFAWFIHGVDLIWGTGG
jgi:hypothetical protein